jgi:hypothetical protein
MFSDIEIAKEVYGRLLEARKILANSVADIKGRCSEGEYFQTAKESVTHLAPIQKRYPTVVPPDEAR